MDIESLNEKNTAEWNDFCLSSNSAWFRHTTWWMDYILNCRFDSNSKNHSFMIRQNSQIVAIVPLVSQYIFNNNKNNEFANYDTPTPFFALKNNNDSINRDEVVKFIFNEIEKRAEQNEVKQASFFIDPLIDEDYFSLFKYYNLFKFQYTLQAKTTNIIDLNADSEEILRQMRKGHKAAVKAVFRDFDF